MATQEALRAVLEKFGTRTKPLRPETKRGWRVIVERENGSLKELEFDDFVRLNFVSDRFGRVTFGESANGAFDQWSIHEVGGGGSIIVPWTVVDHELYVGLVEEQRGYANERGRAWNVPRGAMNPGTTHFETAASEFSEEVGTAPATERIVELVGEPGNCNSTFFETHGKLVDGSPEGLRFFSYSFAPREVVTVEGKTRRYRLGVALTPKSSIGEKIFKCEFWPWWQAVALSDLFTGMGIARLLRHVTHEREPMDISFHAR